MSFSRFVFTAIFTTTLVPLTVTWGIEWIDRAGELVYMEDAESELKPS